MDSSTKLLNILKEASLYYKTPEFTYEWEWEMFTLPSQTIFMDNKAVHLTHDIYFDFGEIELDKLVESGYLEKIERNEEKEVLRIKYKFKNTTQFP